MTSKVISTKYMSCEEGTGHDAHCDQLTRLITCLWHEDSVVRYMGVITAPQYTTELQTRIL